MIIKYLSLNIRNNSGVSATRFWS